MYEVEMLIRNNWYPIVESCDISQIDTILLVLKQTHPENEIRVLENKDVIVFLHGLNKNYDFWYENFVKNNKNKQYQKIKPQKIAKI